MCGRARSTTRPSDIRNILNRVLNVGSEASLTNAAADVAVNNAENLTPGMSLYVAYVNNNNEICVDMMTWGIKVSKMTLFNTRSEELVKKPMFGRMLKENRGVVLLDGFYEYVSNGKGKSKTKYMITPAEGDYFAIPVLFNKKGRFTILTQPPVSDVYHKIHDRQPVIMSYPQLHCWICAKEHYVQYDNIKNIDNVVNTFKLEVVSN